MASNSVLRGAGGQFRTDVGSPPPDDIVSSRPGNTTTPTSPGMLPGQEDVKFWITDFDYSEKDNELLHHRQTFKISELWKGMVKIPGTNKVESTVLAKMNDAWDSFLRKRLNGADRPASVKKVRWIHFPDNNQTWAQKMLGELRAQSMGVYSVPHNTPETRFWSDAFFKDRTNSFGKSHYHARFMRPFCQKWTSTSDTTKSEVVFMAPYLHWELYRDYQIMRRLVEEVQNQEAGRELFSQNLQQNRTQIRRSLDQSFYWTVSDTTRRDRDQVIDRYAREYLRQEDDQRAILMVDQLWLWIVDEEATKRTILTLFPQIWKPGSEDPAHKAVQKTESLKEHVKEKPTAPNDPIDVFDQIFHFLNSEKEKANKYRSVTEIACLIIDRCAGNIVDEKLIDDPDRQYIEFYNRYIDLLMDEQKGCLEKLDERLDHEIRRSKGRRSSLVGQPSSGAEEFRPFSQDQAETLSLAPTERVQHPDHTDENEDESSSFSIAHEFKILKGIRDIIEEVGMMLDILDKQKEAIGSLASQYRPASIKGSKRSITLPGATLKKLEWFDGSARAMSRSRHNTLSEPDFSPPGSPKIPPQDRPRNETKGKDAKKAKKESYVSNINEGANSKDKNQTAGSKQGRLADGVDPQTVKRLGENLVPDEVQKLCLKAVLRERTLNKLREKARAAEKSILHLLELKQQQANVLETRSSRKIAQASELQSEAIMLFTVVTIFFLPLSTIASIYGMNSSDLGQNGGPRLNEIWKILFPVSGGLAVGILYLAFHRRVRRIFSLVLALVWFSLTDWIPFTWLLSYLEQALDQKVEGRHSTRKQRQKAKVEEKRARKEEERKRKAKPRESGQSNGEKKAREEAQSRGEQVSKRTNKHEATQGRTSMDVRGQAQKAETADEAKAREKREGKMPARESLEDRDGNDNLGQPSSSNQSSSKPNSSDKGNVNQSSGSSGTKVAGASDDQTQPRPGPSQNGQSSASQPPDNSSNSDQNATVKSNPAAAIGSPTVELAKKRSKRQAILSIFSNPFGSRSRRSFDVEDQRQQKGSERSSPGSRGSKTSDSHASSPKGETKQVVNAKGKGKEKEVLPADTDIDNKIPTLASASTNAPTSATAATAATHDPTASLAGPQAALPPQSLPGAEVPATTTTRTSTNPRSTSPSTYEPPQPQLQRHHTTPVTPSSHETHEMHDLNRSGSRQHQGAAAQGAAEGPRPSSTRRNTSVNASRSGSVSGSVAAEMGSRLEDDDEDGDGTGTGTGTGDRSMDAID